MGRSFPLDYLSLEWLSLGVEAGGRRRMRVDDRAGTRSEKRGGARSMRMRRCGGITKTAVLVLPLIPKHTFWYAPSLTLVTLELDACDTK